jgi:protein-S-isoprenylcysteine O-methyltransferase Ste14
MKSNVTKGLTIRSRERLAGIESRAGGPGKLPIDGGRRRAGNVIARLGSIVVSIVVEIIVLAVSWAIVALHIQATRSHFVSEKMARGAMFLAILVVGSTLIFSVLLFVAGPQPLAVSIVGVLIELGSLWLFRAAITASREARLAFAFDPAMPHGLVNNGPYRLVRHPFYTSYVLFWIGWAISIWSPWVLPFVVGLVAFYVGAARGEERKFAATALGPDYQRYRESTGFFWPKLGGFSRLSQAGE